MPDDADVKPTGTAADAIPGLEPGGAPKAPAGTPETGATIPEHTDTPAGESDGSAREALPTEGQADRAVDRAADRAEGQQ